MVLWNAGCGNRVYLCVWGTTAEERRRTRRVFGISEIILGAFWRSYFDWFDKDAFYRLDLDAFDWADWTRYFPGYIFWVSWTFSGFWGEILCVGCTETWETRRRNDLVVGKSVASVKSNRCMENLGRKGRKRKEREG